MENPVGHNHPTGEKVIPSGTVETNEKSTRFASHYNLRPTFDINCFDCCFEYLTKYRNYGTVIGNSYQVYYGNTSNWTNCYLAVPSGKHGQFKTDSIEHLQPFSMTTVKGGLTYKVYTNVNPEIAAIGVRVQTTTRLESITIKEVKPDLINGSKLNCRNAALLEIYREMNGENSLLGVCEKPLGDAFTKMTIKQ